MFKSLAIENLRSLRSMELAAPRRVNLLTGKNNSGKTTVLEGVFLLAGARSPDDLTTLRRIRGESTVAVTRDRETPLPWDSLFPELARASSTIELSALIEGRSAERWAGSGTYTLSISHQPEPVAIGPQIFAARVIGPLNTLDTTRLAWALEYRLTGPREAATPLDETRQLLALDGELTLAPEASAPLPAFFFGSWGREYTQAAQTLRRLQQANALDPVLAVSRAVIPDLVTLELGLAANGIPQVDVRMSSSSRALPLHLLGDGARRVVSIALAATSVRGGLLLIDEVENGIHWSAMRDVWRGLIALAQALDLQVFATTHSAECIFALVDSAREADALNEVAVHRLDRTEDGTRVATYDEDTLAFAADEGWEVR
jgi:predicted ATPase